MASYTLSALAELVGAQLVGDGERQIEGVGTLQGASVGQISFLTNSKYRKQLAATQAGAVILREADLDQCPTAALVCSNPHATYARISQCFANEPRHPEGIHPSALVPASCVIGPGVHIGAQVVLGEGVEIGAGSVIEAGCSVGEGSRLGAGCHLFPRVVIYHQCRLGDRVRLHSGVVVGSDGFGFAYDPEGWIKVAQVGGVVIEDDVEVGANTTIDAGAIEPTHIGRGVKLDNQIQIAHNVSIGDHTVIAGCVGIAGSTRIGAHCAIGGGAGILGHLEIVDGTTITATSLVTKSVKAPGVYSSGTPLQPSEQWQKNFARFKQLDEMARRLKQLEQQLAALAKV